jgi:hypothetical protein
MSDEQSPSSYALFIALAVVLVLFVLALVGVLVAALIVFVFAQAAPTDTQQAAPLNRLAVIADGRLYTIAPDGSDRVDLTHNGRVPTAAVVWSHDGQRLIFIESQRDQSSVISARPDWQEAACSTKPSDTRTLLFVRFAGRSARGLSGL